MGDEEEPSDDSIIRLFDDSIISLSASSACSAVWPSAVQKMALTSPALKR